MKANHQDTKTPRPQGTQIFGAQLKVGDVIKVWWQPGRDTVIGLREYDGAYQGAPGWDGVRLADFAQTKTGMTIFPGETFDVVFVQELSRILREERGA